MTPEELYEKEFGNADNVPKEQVIRLLKNFARVLHIERSNALRILDIQVKSEQLECDCQSPETGHYSNFCPIHNERPYDPKLVLYNIERQSEQLPCKHNYQLDTTCGVDITCCKKCGDII